MDAKERWQALQARLAAARGFINANDRARALVEIDAALELDPDFLAAQALRERLLSPADDSAIAQPPNDAVAAPRAGAPAPAERPLVSTTGYAKFEERAKRRRVDRRLDAARLAIDGRRLKDAAAALDEVIGLDPNLPELIPLTAAFDDLRRAAERKSRGPRYTAAAVFAALVFGASWIDDQTGLQARPMVSVAGLISTLAPPPLESSLAAEAVEPVGTAGTNAVPAPAVEHPAAAPVAVSRAALDNPSPESGVAPAVDTAPPSPPPVVGPPAAAPSVVVPQPRTDEEVLVKQALQRYRVAYDGLDAQSAHAVWPAVNQAALARAFDGLESQSLTFDACDVRVQTETSATAVCRGTARYVPKVGSRDPRIEPRVWSFSLRKSAADWKIDSARVER